MGTPFATATQLEKRWRKLSEQEQARADVLLNDASDLIRDLCPHWEQIKPETLERVVCSMVRRAMGADDAEIAPGITSGMVTAGHYSQQYSFSAPAGDLYLTKLEKKILGLGSGGAFQIDLLAGVE